MAKKGKFPGENKHILTQEDRIRGGKNLQKKNAEKRKLKECLEILLATEMGEDKDGNPISGAEAMAIRAINSAIKGDWKAWELVRDTSGQKPVDQKEILNSDININITGTDDDKS